MFKLILSKTLPVVVAAAFAFLLAAPFFLSRDGYTHGGKSIKNIPLTHDLVQHVGVMEDFDEVLRHGVLYPRWLPNLNHGYGLPWMNYYPPGFYYLTSLVHTVVEDWIDTLFVVSVLGFAASGLAFYGLSRLFYSRTASALAGTLYMALPFHVIELYWRGAMPQFFGYVLLPLVVYFAFKVGAYGRAGNYAGLAFCYGLYLMTHTPTGLLLSYTLALYGVLWALQQRHWRPARRIALGMNLGILFAAIYLLPGAIERQDMQEHFSAIFPYHNSYVALDASDYFGSAVKLCLAIQLLVTLVAAVILRRRPATTQTPAEPSTDVSPQTVSSETVSLTTSAKNGSAIASRVTAASGAQTLLWVVLGAVTTLMCTSLSKPVAKLLPQIQVATFAWRWLTIASLFAALAVAAAIDHLRQGSRFAPLRRWLYAAALVVVCGVAGWYTVSGVIGGAMAHPSQMQPFSYLDAGFTPRGSKDPRDLPGTERVVLQPEGGTHEIIRWEPTRREILVTTQEPRTVRLKTYNFPGWTARLDGVEAPILGFDDGVQHVTVPAGTHQLEVTFHNTPPRTFGAALTLLSLALILALALFSAWQRRKANQQHRREGSPGV